MSQSLILAVAGHQAAQFGSRSSGTFAAVGGSIGRSEDCDWVLSASGVSRVHAMVRYLNGIYFIEDRSTNGMLLNGAPLAKGEPSALADGDRLLIDTFEVEVHLRDAGAAASAADLLAPAAPAAAADIDPLDFGLSPPAAPLPARPSPVVPLTRAMSCARQWSSACWSAAAPLKSTMTSIGGACVQSWVYRSVPLAAPGTGWPSSTDP